MLARQYQSLMHEMVLFDAGNSQFSTMESLLGHFWQNELAFVARLPLKSIRQTDALFCYGSTVPWRRRD